MDIDYSTLPNFYPPESGEDTLPEQTPQDTPQDEEPPALATVTEATSGSMLDDRFARLERRLHDLLRLFERMVEENQDLRARHAELLAECEHLQRSREQTQARLDAMVLRLRSLEPSL